MVILICTEDLFRKIERDETKILSEGKQHEDRWRVLQAGSICTGNGRDIEGSSMIKVLLYEN